ncbi:MAG: YidC/Oxa1 family membrane protein insertase [Dethiosulfatibacter sp.]|nr:YidC/Oxa1 family membrane protein insertase [Dethiosulfatibacter sp.]
MQIIARPLGFIVKIIYDLLSVLDNPIISAYALSIIVASILLKLVLFPLTKKQTDSMKKMQELNPLLSQLKQKYKNDKETLNRKTMELYKENNVNPMGGCLPLLIQFPFLIGFFYVLREPVTYVFSGNQATYDAINKSFIWIKDLGFAANAQVSEGVINGINLGTALPLIGQALPVLAILAGITTYIQTKMTTAGQSGGNEQQAATQNTMAIMMPFMIFFFALNFPAGLTLYWVVSNLFQIAQQYLALHNGKRLLEVKTK